MCISLYLCRMQKHVHVYIILYTSIYLYIYMGVFTLCICVMYIRSSNGDFIFSYIKAYLLFIAKGIAVH